MHANQIPGHQAAEVQEQAWGGRKERGQKETGDKLALWKPQYWHLSPGVPQWPPVHEGSFVRA